MSNALAGEHPDDVILRAENVSKTYPDGNVNAVADVSLAICRGKYIAICGASGSGKSTLLNLFGALDVPTRGRILFENKPLAEETDLDRFRADKIGFVFQSFLLLPTLTAAENVQVPMFEGPRSRSERAARATELLSMVGLSHRAHHLPNQMSVGERQRAAIARALANDPPVLLADEPTGNLDSRTGAEILDLFDQLHRQRGMTLVVITHSDYVASRAQQVITISDGRIVSDLRRDAR